MAIATGTAIIAGSLLAGAVASNSASKSAKAQAKGQEAGITETSRQFNLTRDDLQRAEGVNRLDLEAGQAQQREDLSPYASAGVEALGRQRSLVGFGGEEDQEKAFAAFGNSPGQKFLRDRARKNLLRSASSVGGNYGGNVLSALTQQGVDYAAQDFNNEFERLGQLRTSGQRAASELGVGALTTAGGKGSGAINTAARTGQFGERASSNISALRDAQGQSRASGIEGRNSAIQSGMEGIFTGASRSGFFQKGKEFTLPAANINPFSRTA